MIEKLNASKGTEEYHVGEIFLSATPDTQAQTIANATKILEQIEKRRILRRLRAPIFGGVDGRGRRRPRLGPAGTASGAARRRGAADAARARSATQFLFRGGVSILAVQDTRKILTARSARRGPQPEAGVDHLSQGHRATRWQSRSSRDSARPRAPSAAAAAPTRSRPISTAKSSAGWREDARPPAGAAADDAADAGRPGDAAVRFARGGRSDARDLRPRRGRPESAPSYDEVYNQLNEERVNSRSRRYLRDLRRDAVIEFR